MAAGAWTKFDKAVYYGMIGTIDYDDAGAGIFKCALLADTYTPDTTDDTWADLSAHDLGTANGYTAAGVALTSVTYTNATGTDTWDCDNPTWTAAGGSIGPAKYAVMYHVASGKLICYCELEVGSTKTATTGNDFVIQNSTSGVYSIT